MADPLQYTVTDGVADVWTPPSDGGADPSDCRPHVRELLDSLQLETTDVESAEIEFGAGVYDFTNVGGGSIELEDVRDLTLAGLEPE